MSKASKQIIKYTQEFINSCPLIENKEEVLKYLTSDTHKEAVEGFIEANGVSIKKDKKDPNAPKKPATAFLLFSNEKRQSVKDEFPDIDPKEIMAKLGELWRAATDAEKAPYEEIAKGKKQEYDGKMSVFKKKDEKPKTAFHFFKISKIDEVNRANPGIAKKDSHKKIQMMWKELKSEKCETVKKFERLAKEGPKEDTEDTDDESQPINLGVDEETQLCQPESPKIEKKKEKVKKTKKKKVNEDEE
jgi:hypothetical protein